MELLEKAIALAPKVQGIVGEVLSRHIGRYQEVWTALLSLIAGHPVFYLGTPGVDKTGTVKAVARRIAGAKFFSAMMPGVTSFEQLFIAHTAIEEREENGAKLIAPRDVPGLAAAAHIFFGDEIWKAEATLLNPLLDFANGDGVRIEGETIKTPLVSFVAASNELPDPENNLSALWSRMTIRVVVHPLSWEEKDRLVDARLERDRQESLGTEETQAEVTLDEVSLLRRARPFVELPKDIRQVVVEIIQSLSSAEQDFSEMFDGEGRFADDRRFGRLFDVMQANALLSGRTTVVKSDMVVLEWLLWDRPEQIAVVKAKVAPYCRTALSDAQELLDTLLAPGGTVAAVLGGDRAKGVQALTQVEETEKELVRLSGEADDAAMKVSIAELAQKVKEAKEGVVAKVLGQA